MKIISNNCIAKDTYELILDAREIKEIKAGQFMHLKSGRDDLILRRPISIASYNEEELNLVYKVIGEGTKAMSLFEPGEEVDALGPLGNGFDLLDVEEVLIVGGGMGVAPLYQLAKEFTHKNIRVTSVLGFGSADMTYYIEKFQVLGEVIITTDDGSMGVKGNVGNVVNELKEFDAIYACGPWPLLYYLQMTFDDHPHLYVSLEERMACGIGACYACDTKDKKHRICTDGPVFNIKEVEL